MPFIDISTGLNVATQSPLNEKTYFKTLAEMIDLGTSSNKAFTYYEGMIVFCLETEKEYIWKQTEVIVPSDVALLLPTNFVYPSNSVSNGIDYSGRAFNFRLFSHEEFDPTSILTSLNSNIKSVGDGIEIYKGLDTNDDKHQIKSIDNIGSVDGIELVSQNALEEKILISKVKSNSINISKNLNGDVVFELPEVTEGLRPFYVNNNYTGTEEVGTIAKPYKNIQNALIAYIGTGTKDAPEFLNSKVIVQASNNNYALTTNLNISNLDLTLEEGALVVYSGADDYMLDSREFLSTTNSSNRFRGGGTFRIDELKGFIYNIHTEDGVHYKDAKFYDNLIFINIHVPSGQTITDVPQTVGGTDYYPSITSPGQNAIFFTGSSMQMPLFVLKARRPDSINFTLYGKVNITSFTQTHIVLEDNAFIRTIGTLPTGIFFGNNSGILLIDGLDTNILIGQPNILLPSTTYKYLSFDDTSTAIFSELSFGLGGTYTRIKELINFKSAYLGAGIQVEKGSWNGIEEALACVNFENGSTGRVVLNNVTAGSCTEVTIRNEDINTHTLSTINNCVFNTKISSNIDLTRGNVVSVENRINNKLKLSLVKYPTRALAETAGLESGDRFINTNNNDVDASTHFLDIII